MPRLTLLLLLCAPLLALAQDDDRKDRWKRLMQRFDKDGDGSLSADERKAMQDAIAAWRARHGGGSGGSGEKAATKPTIPRPGTALYGAVQGVFRIGSVARVDLDGVRLRVTYPDGPAKQGGEVPGGPYPLIVWSHGAYGSKDNYRPLCDHWASHGYVVVQPTHPDSATLGTRPGDPAAFRKWAERPKQVSAVITAARDGRLIELAPALKGKLDGQVVGVGGHSFGAHTSQLIGGVVPATGSVRDARVRAVLLVSPQGRGDLLRDASAWKPLTLPAMVVSGDKDSSGRTGKPAKWRREPYDFAPAGLGKWLVWIRDAHHNFGGIAHDRDIGTGGRNADHVRIVQTASLAFWDAHLYRREAARTYLAGDALVRATGMVTLERKPAPRRDRADQKSALEEALGK